MQLKWKMGHWCLVCVHREQNVETGKLELTKVGNGAHVVFHGTLPVPDKKLVLMSIGTLCILKGYTYVIYLAQDLPYNLELNML
jgi:hypothetical protein